MFSSRGRIILFLIILLAATLYGYFSLRDESGNVRYKTHVVDHGDIARTISANGTLTPLELVEVGTQISGRVIQLFADFNDEVKTGQILAKLDPALLDAQLQQSEANLKSAQTALSVAINKDRRSRNLVERGFISREAMDESKELLDSARAQVVVSQAQIARDRTNLDYSIIRSPVSGVVIARNVNIGQTVAANFQTPILFQIARDLKQMQIEISVVEADIGQIHDGQTMVFTVDAFQDREFSAVVKQIRLNPTIQENVVTYSVIATVINEDGSLLPGMTANVRFIVNEKSGVLRVPNAALRYKPSRKEFAKPTDTQPGQRLLYRLENNRPVPVKVATGITDGSFTEILSGELNANDELITEEIDDSKQDKSGGSNFKFRMF
ncbi:efflux RND transporter periplasmic adaptor subunit [Nitrosomonas eutropha]|uniref:HlyD family secretion protein n=2 Tax=Nitrosomonas eutropha TaxID=916 RepID=A0ABX5M7K3_9PROT|nr:efflux RND transporter periplasmic adaptor subunit [Nitrosomonas eutropha]ABI60233.1 efflux transporter, RND family, MFP subunit [Nitrosomonas eutropha C91]PXV81728.1 HlyD family secretion protein [Nitrosomonas eutropha]SCX11483.1 HlyD family secretion protein [Nitrosomonas eutropha]SEI71163.1 HlyD family secretion protein [Nitrosomonas eutropha]